MVTLHSLSSRVCSDQSHYSLVFFLFVFSVVLSTQCGFSSFSMRFSCCLVLLFNFFLILAVLFIGFSASFSLL